MQRKYPLVCLYPVPLFLSLFTSVLICTIFWCQQDNWNRRPAMLTLRTRGWLFPAVSHYVGPSHHQLQRGCHAQLQAAPGMVTPSRKVCVGSTISSIWLVSRAQPLQFDLAAPLWPDAVKSTSTSLLPPRSVSLHTPPPSMPHLSTARWLQVLGIQACTVRASCQPLLPSLRWVQLWGIGGAQELCETYNRVAIRNTSKCLTPGCENFANMSKGGYCNSCAEQERIRDEMIGRGILGDEAIG